MNNLLIFFIFPLATIIISVVLEKAFNSPISVTAFVFALAIVITFIAYSPADLIYAIIYTLLSYIVAVITCFIMKLCNSDEEDAEGDSENNGCDCFRENTVNAKSNITGYNQMGYGCSMRGRR